MAGAYKGLTIRIGADTTKLTAAMRGASSAIYKTQSEINKLSKALKLDPGNQNAASLQMGRLSEQTGNAAREIEVLKRGIGELATTPLFDKDGKIIDDSSVAELAASTEDATHKAQEWTDAYTKTNKELDTLYGKLNAISGREGTLAFSNANGNTSMEEITNEVEKLVADQKMSREEADLYLETVASVKQRWTEARSEMDNYSNAARLGELNDKLALADSTIKKVAHDYAEMVSKSDTSKAVQPLKDELDVISRASDTASDRFRRLNEASRLNPTSIGTAADRARALGEATRVAQEKAKSLKELINAYKADGIDKLAAGASDSALEFERAKEKVASLREELDRAKESSGENSSKAIELRKALAEAEKDAKTKGAVNEYRELQTQLREVEAESRSMRGSLASDLQGVGAAAVQAAVEVGNLMKQAGQAIVESSNEIDSSYRDLRKTFDASEGEYQSLYDAAMEFSKSNVTSADKMLEMESIAAQLGVGLDDAGNKTANATEQIRKFAEVGANLDVATNIEAEDIALQMGQIQNVMDDLSPDNIDSFGDALVRLGNTMPTQESNIMQITQRLAAVGSVTSFTTPELMGWAAAIASTGQRSEAAATGISNTITAIQKAVGSGGDDLKLFAKTAGMSAEEFSKAWSESPTDALKAFLGGLSTLGDESLQRLEDLDITGVRQTQTLLALAKTVDTVDVAIGNAEDAWNGGGDAATEATKKAEGFSGSLAKMQNSAQVLAATFGESLKPYIDMAADAMNRLSDFINSLDDDTRGAVVLFGMLTAAAATLAPIITSLFGAWSTLGGNMQKFAVNGIGALSAKFGDLATYVLAAETPMEGLSVALSSAAGKAVAPFTAKVGALGKALGTAATSGNLFLGIFGGAFAATLVDYVRQMAESAAEAKRFDDAMAGLKETTNGLSAELWDGKEAVMSWDGASSGINDLLSSLEEHNRANRDTRKEAATTIGELERYGDVIADAAGKGSEFAGSELELQTAVEGLNEILGTNYTKADVLSGVYLDQSGAAQDLASKIDMLVEAKKRELRLTAMEDIYKEDYKAHVEAENAYEKAAAAREKFLDEWKSEHLGQTTVDPTTKNLTTVDESNWETLARQSEGYRDLTQAMNETKEAVNETGEALDITEKQWQGYADEAAYLTTENFGLREGIMMTSEALSGAIMENTDWGDKLQEIQPKVGELAQKLQDAKVGVSEFSDMAKNNPDVFREMVEKSGGDMDALVSDLAGYFAEIREDNLEWNGNEWKPVELKAENYATDTIAKASEELRKAIADTNVSVGDLMLGLEGAGVSTEQFTSLSAQQFATLAEAAGGDVDGIVAAIAGLNGIQLDDKTMGFRFDEEGNLVNAEGQLMELTEEGWSVRVDTDSSSIDEAAQKAESLDGGEVKLTETADTTQAEQDTQALKEKVESEPVTQKVKTEVDGAEQTPDGSAAKVTVELDDADASAKLAELTADRTVRIGVATDEESLSAAASAISAAMSGTGATSTASVDTKAATSSIDALKQKIGSVPKSTSTKVTASVAGKERVDALIKSLKDASKKWSASLTANVYGKGGVDDLLRTLANANGKKYSVTFDTYRVTHYSTVKDGPHAAGTYIDPNRMPRHAAGGAGIFTRPTLTNIGWVGEDGAELYSGNSLVPLTNRKYSMPYINDISDAVAKKIGPVSSGNQITLNVSCEGSPDDVASAITRALTTLDI